MATRFCEKCGKTMEENNFYTYRNGNKLELCKKCLTMHIDNFDPETFLWILEKVDVPYVESEWNSLRDKAFARDPLKMNGMTVFGKYLSKMKLKQWKNYSWADTERIKEEQDAKIAAIKDKEEEDTLEFEAKLKEMLKAGIITESEYRTKVSTATLKKDYEAGLLSYPVPDPHGELSNDSSAYDESQFLSEDDIPSIDEELTKEDKIALAIKWGRLYKPSEWISLEKKYREMKESFDIQDSDTESTLILLCKTYLKMNQAIDCGDVESFQKLSKVYDSTRKTSKFTAQQNKEEKQEFMNTVSELVYYCEKNGGVIPRYEIETDYDIVDTVIKDLKAYTKSLIYQDVSLAAQIEDYIKRRDSAEAMRKDKEKAKAEGKDKVEITDEDVRKYHEQIEKMREKDAKTSGGEQGEES